MHEIYLIDTSCLIALEKAEILSILKELYGSVITTPEVAKEYQFPLPEWVIIQQVVDKNYQKILENSIDKGESSIIALGLSIPDSILILDDLKARKYAKRLGFEITGTFGILYKAKLAAKIDKVKPYIEKLKTAGFRISEIIEKELLKLCDE